MPELPDIEVYVHALRERVAGRRVVAVRLGNPFFLRTAEPPIGAATGRTVGEIRRVGKRIALQLDDDRWLVMHLMIAGRLQWLDEARRLRKRDLAGLDFETGTLLVTEAGTKRRAWLKLLESTEALLQEDPGGLEPLEISAAQFATQLRGANHTLKRALTHPAKFSGIGNAYSDEILHRARLSPVALTQSLTDPQMEALYRATQDVLAEWTARLQAQSAGQFPTRVTAFRPEMAVHGRFKQPCPDCGSPVQRIRYAERETNYCARCQTQGKVLRDRSLSLLLKKDWPSRIEQWE